MPIELKPCRRVSSTQSYFCCLERIKTAYFRRCRWHTWNRTGNIEFTVVLIVYQCKWAQKQIFYLAFLWIVKSVSFNFCNFFDYLKFKIEIFAHRFSRIKSSRAAIEKISCKKVLIAPAWCKMVFVRIILWLKCVWRFLENREQLTSGLIAK